MLDPNSDQDKSIIAATKILHAHSHLNMRLFFKWNLNLPSLWPYGLNASKCFAISRHDIRLLSIEFTIFVRAMPMNVVWDMVIKEEGKKRRFDNPWLVDAYVLLEC